MRCPRCGEENPDHARFCLSCGTSLTADNVQREVRKVVTVVFADVSGSTALGERLDPESLRRVMSRYFEEMKSVLERHGGTVEKFIGDAVMAVFGVPVLHEDDALRAVRAAAEMREVLEVLNEELAREWDVRLRIRTGVNTGEVVVGDPATGGTLLLGDAVNVAARLEQSAEVGEILIGSETHRLVHHVVDADPTEPLPLKGKKEPVTAYRVTAVRTGPAGVPRRAGARMVGRRRERTLLRQAFERAREERSCHLFTVLGSAGVGKSRLASEFMAACRLEARVLTGRCLPYGEGITFWPLLEIVRDAAALSDKDGSDDARKKIAALLGAEEDGTLVAERVAQVVGLARTPGEPEETAWAVRRLFEGLARDRPVVVIVDDLHWAEPTLLEVIEHVADWARDAALLVVCVARPELLDHRPAWGGGKMNATSILLEPLNDSESVQLVENLLGGPGVDPAARDRISEAGEGNPLFLEELVYMLVDDGTLRRDDGRWVAAGELGDVDVPPTISALLGARLERLDPVQREVIERASVEGKVFHRGAVAALSPSITPDAMEDSLRALVRKELVQPERPDFAGEEAFGFRHLLIRDAAYRGVPKQTRADLHARFADWLAAAAGQRLAEYEEIVGYHLEEAHRYRTELGPADDAARDLGRRAADWLARAGRRAIDRGDVPAAVNLLGRAVTLQPQPSPERAEALLDLGTVLYEAGEFGRAQDVLARAVDLARAEDLPALEWMARLELLVIGAERGFLPAEEVGQEAERAVAVFEDLADEAGLARAWHVIALRHWLDARATPTEEALERAVRHAALAGDRRQEATDLALMTMVSSWGPRTVESAIRRCQEIRQRSGGHLAVEAQSLVTLAHLEASRGRFDEARRLDSEGRTLLRELGLEVLAAATAHGSAFIELAAGDLEAAEAELRAGYEALDRIGEKAYLSTVAADLAEVMYRQGRLDEAERYTALSEEASDPNDLAAQIGWRAVRGKIEARRGDLKKGERLARDAVSLAEDTDLLDF
ncbi:MAG TPA: adenylate/guanylate cyclase domain-containing protein, partial [Actinomycetota bacterium]|nr:adenylate/guanylate cyclase domain-containing protein [Actinomycetota bacterium]